MLRNYTRFDSWQQLMPSRIEDVNEIQINTCMHILTTENI